MSSTDCANQEPRPAAARGAPSLVEAVRGLRGSNLLVLTTLGAIDGTVFLLAASGALATWSGAVVAGLTVVAGAGAWIAAREEFVQRGGRSDGRRGRQRSADGAGRAALDRAAWLRLAAIACVAIAATVAAAWAGAALAGRIELHVLPTAAGVVLLLVAAEVAGLDLPRPRGLPLPVAALLGAVALEAALGLSMLASSWGVAA